MTDRDLIRRLEDQPVPPPPDGLAERIINEIPEDLELHPDLDEVKVRRPFHRRPAWLAAAAAAAVALGGVVTWEVQRRQPDLGSLVTVHEEQGNTVPDTKMLRQMESESIPDRGGADAVVGGERSAPTRGDDELGARPTNEEVTETDVAQVWRDQAMKPVPSRPQTRPTQPPEVVRPKKARTIPIPDPSPNDSVVQNRLVGEGRQGRGADKGAHLEERNRFVGDLQVTAEVPVVDVTSTVSGSTVDGNAEAEKRSFSPAPSTGGTAEPNDQPFGDVFFEHTGVNPFVDAEDDRLSTFGLDVDTGSFTVARRYLSGGHLPPASAVRVEEWVNAFDYGDEAPEKDDFRLIVEGAPSAFASNDRIVTLRMAVKAREVDASARPSAVLVFCIDVSGSMNQQNRLGLVKQALHELLGSLRSDDHVGLVIYGSSGRVVLKPTTDHDRIRAAVDALRSGGSTNAEEGLALAYDLLSDGDDDGRIRRVILCSDGVANVGRTGPKSILERIRSEAAAGIELTTVGFGMGNYNDTLMEQLADTGNGRYAYVDALPEARRIFVDQLTGTLMTLGHDAKAQVEFNPDVVSRWRLLGYENRDIADELFRDPTVDAGEIGSGHTVTALYEVKLRKRVHNRDAVATLRLRYRPTGADDEREFERTLRVSDLNQRWEHASPALRTASTVAEFAEILKGAYWAKDGSLDEVRRQVDRLADRSDVDHERIESLRMMIRQAMDASGD